MQYSPPLRRVDQNMDDLEAVSPGLQMEFHPLDPSVKMLWFLGRLVFWLIAGSGITAILLLLMAARPDWFIGLAIGISVFGSLVLLSIIWPFVSYKHWGYAIRETDFIIRSGVIWKRLSAVPFSRIQHVDSNAGPLERFFDISNLTIHTAGASAGSLSVPGLQTEHAEELRDYLSEVGHTHANL